MGDSIIYARVSTGKQDIEHQRENLWSYATEDLGVDEADLDVLSDVATGTNTDRSGYREMMRRVRDGDVERVIVREVTRLGRTMRAISENVHEMIEDHDVGLFVMNDSIEVEPSGELDMRDKMLLNVLAWSAELEAKKIKENIHAGLRAAEDAGKWVGRPPYGFTTDADGYLQPNENFSNAYQAIRAIEDDGWSKRKASRHSGVPRSTLGNILERKDLYEAEAPENT